MAEDPQHTLFALVNKLQVHKIQLILHPLDTPDSRTEVDKNFDAIARLPITDDELIEPTGNDYILRNHANEGPLTSTALSIRESWPNGAHLLVGPRELESIINRISTSTIGQPHLFYCPQTESGILGALEDALNALE